MFTQIDVQNIANCPVYGKCTERMVYYNAEHVEIPIKKNKVWLNPMGLVFID